MCGFTNQKNFLKNLGIFERAEIISKNLTFSKKADIYYRIKRLTDENAMGGLFKVMFLTKKNAKFQIGFKNWLNQKNLKNSKISRTLFLIKKVESQMEYIKVLIVAWVL